VHQNGSFAERDRFLGTYHPCPATGCTAMTAALYRCYTAMRHQQFCHFLWFGIAISDIDLDGYPDLYIGNDFHENDYLYINQKNGTFRDELTSHLMHTSQFTMGVDVADVTNDGFPEIISMDMLPADPYILKRSLGENEFNIFNLKNRLWIQLPVYTQQPAMEPPQWAVQRSGLVRWCSRYRLELGAALDGF
jgi:hypothetical protein